MSVPVTLTSALSLVFAPALTPTLSPFDSAKTRSAQIRQEKEESERVRRVCMSPSRLR